MKPERPRRPLPEALKEEIRLQVKLRWGSRSGTWTWGQRRRLGAGRTQTKGTSWEGVQGRRQRGRHRGPGGWVALREPFLIQLHLVPGKLTGLPGSGPAEKLG